MLIPPLCPFVARLDLAKRSVAIFSVESAALLWVSPVLAARGSTLQEIGGGRWQEFVNPAELAALVAFIQRAPDGAVMVFEGAQQDGWVRCSALVYTIASPSCAACPHRCDGVDGRRLLFTASVPAPLLPAPPSEGAAAWDELS